MLEDQAYAMVRASGQTRIHITQVDKIIARIYNSIKQETCTNCSSGNTIMYENSIHCNLGISDGALKLGNKPTFKCNKWEKD